MISVEKVDTLEGFDALRDDWDRLLAKSDFRTIFQTFDWLRTWWKVFGDNKQMYILVIRQEDVVIGIAPFMLEEARSLGKSGRVIRFIGTPNVDYADIMAEDKEPVIAQVADYLMCNEADWTSIELGQVSERSSTMKTLKRLFGEKGAKFRADEIETCFSYVYEGDEADRSTFTLKKNRTLKTAINVLGKNKGLVLERITDLPSLHRHLTVLFSLHIKRWAGTPTPSKFTDEKNREFYKELVEALVPSDRIYFVTLRNGDVPVACCFSFGYEKTINLYTVAMNPYFHKRSPGLLFFTLQAELLIRQGFALDYSRGAQPYKSGLTNGHSTNHQITVFRRKLDYLRATVYENSKKTGIGKIVRSNRRVQYYKLRLTNLLQRWGIAGLMWRIIVLTVKSIIDYKAFYVFRHHGRQETVSSPRIDVEIKMLGIEDADLIATFYGVREGSDKHRTIIRRFESKAECFAVFHNGNIVYISWALFNEDSWRYYKLSLKAGENEVIISDVLASPIYRNMGLYTYMLGYKLNKYSREGCRVLCVIDKSNIAALKVTRKFGFDRVRTFRRLRLFSRWVL
jgi:CelD/BcsL family acetyltransferase involved in cellulose biosynthesis